MEMFIALVAIAFVTIMFYTARKLSESKNI